MPLRVTTITLLLQLAMYVQGIERVKVNKLGIDDDVLISNDEEIPAIESDVTGSESRSHAFKGILALCYIFGNCSCPSLCTALANLTSNTLINVTTDMTLSSVITFADLTNITIIGHNNPTVKCNNSGGLHFASCHNCIIQGIIWDGCGANIIKENANVSHPVLQLINSSNITIKNCSFQSSIGQAIVLSQMTGDVGISHCNFLCNYHYKGHGSAIHYSSNGVSTNFLTFMIVSSNFTHNKGAKSVVYFNRSSRSAHSCEYLYLQNLNFYYNEVPIHLSNQNLYISGDIEFIGNVADNGGGIYISDHSNVTFYKSATINFTHNRANRNGGAIFLTNHSSIVFKEHHTLQRCHDRKPYYIVGDQYYTRSLIAVTFHNNSANEFGGDIYAHNSSIVFGDTTDVKFKGNCMYAHSSCDGISGSSMVYISGQSIMMFGENSSATFTRHSNSGNGGLVYIDDSSIITFEGNSIVNFTGNNGDVIYVTDSSEIKFKGNSSVSFLNNGAYDNGGIMNIDFRSTLTFEGDSAVNFFHNSVNGYNGGVLYSYFFSAITFAGNSNVYFSRNFAHGIGGVMYIDLSTIIFEGSSTVNFSDNHAHGNGGVLYIDQSTITFEENSTVNFFANYNVNSDVMYIDDSSTITFVGSSTVNFLNNIADSSSGVMYIERFSTITFDRNSTVSFINNSAEGNGGVMYIYYDSTIKFKGNSSVNFLDNFVDNNGWVMYIDDHSTITFEENFAVNFVTNENGAVIHIDGFSTITFEGNSSVNFLDNVVDNNGKVMYIDGHSTIAFEGNSSVNFIDNVSVGNGGVIYIDDHSTITFEENCAVNFFTNENGAVIHIDGFSTITFEGNFTVNFAYNHANGTGRMMYIDHHSTIVFKGNSNVNFFTNDNDGVMYIDDSSSITFDENSTVNFLNNIADNNGGVMYIVHSSTVTFKGSSTVNFFNSCAKGNGGVIYIEYHSAITFEGNSTVNFLNNTVDSNGGVMYIVHSSTITFDGNPIVNFIENGADDNGGVMYIEYHSIITFKGNANVNFLNNTADSNSGVMYIVHSATITFDGNPIVNFIENGADDNGGVMYIEYHSTITFKGNAKVNFLNNTADSNSGVMYIVHSSTITFDGNSTVTFTDNGADDNGGVVYIKDHSTIIFKGNSNAKFCRNRASSNGGVMYIDQNSKLKLKERARVVLNGNIAYLGGGIYIKSSSFMVIGNSSFIFINNTALGDGGAIYSRDQLFFKQLEYSNATFYYNSASDYGGAIYALCSNLTSIHFHNNAYFNENSAGTAQNSVYLNVDKSCDRDCFLNSITYTNDIPITTSPNRLVLYNPTKCIDGNETNCDIYYMNNIMLGQDISFGACLLDYYDQRTEAAEFSITGMNHKDYRISSSKYITISCNHTTQAITVVGNLWSNITYNYSINISLYVTRFSESKVVSVNLIIELSQCHPGFWYSLANESQRCECYITGGIISCSGSNSTIKRGYWYGIVTGTPTVATCPNDYCNFTCCEITNGIYHLSPVRANQCRPHRSGTACGSCEEGYTLSFDSPECVDVKRCTVGLVLVTTLSLLYWIVVEIAVFVMMYFKVSFGSLYAIVYYYSVVDILLSRVLFISNKLYSTVTFMSSFAKLTPQFLGQLCLIKNMSGIDQQFIHYVHPVVVFLFLIMISKLAKRSRKVSSFVSKGVIPFICFLLLLSYTSVASTSLLLMRPLTFVGIDEVYTYLSPNIEYLHGHHLAYAIVALILTITIVIGFPLLLLLEPFLNSKINFIKIKPLLDQFQGCYKDKYRYFAGYYMICRLVIILLVIVKISDDFTTQYLLISSCALMQLIHVLVRPYASTIHNIFDGIILQLIVIISVLPVTELVDNYDEVFIISIIYALVILPLIIIVIKAWINNKVVFIQIAFYKSKNIFSSCYYNAIATDDLQETVEIREFGVIVDEHTRRNAIIVDV